MITIDWPTKVISVPQSYLTPVSGSLYELDTDQFRLDLKGIEADEGMPFVDTHRHNTEVEISGVTYARTFEIINGFTVTFEDLQYRVRLAGTNNNISDVANINQVSILSQNSAGLVGNKPIYTGKLLLTDDNSGGTDRYVMIWYKDAQPVTSTITDAKIQAVKATDGSSLIALTPMTQIGSEKDYKYDATGAEKITDGAVYIAKATATIEGSTREWKQQVSRDS